MRVQTAVPVLLLCGELSGNQQEQQYR
jgi:hypothetical protein